MAYDPFKHHRRSIRLKGYDYSQAGAYFITICIKHGQTLLGNIQDSEIKPSKAGEMVADCWDTLPERFHNIDLDVFTLMPNHIHGIIVILDTNLNANNNSVTLGNIVGAFKSISTHKYIEKVETDGWEPFYKKLWQRNFYERIIRNERELNAIRTYITNNPANWNKDKLHPAAPLNKFNTKWKKPTDNA